MQSCTYLIFDIQIQILAFLKERSEDKSFRFVLDNSLIFIELFDTIPNILFSFAPEKDKVKNKIHLHSQVLRNAFFSSWLLFGKRSIICLSFLGEIILFVNLFVQTLASYI